VKAIGLDIALALVALAVVVGMVLERWVFAL